MEIIGAYGKREDDALRSHRSFELGTKRLRDASAFLTWNVSRGRSIGLE